MKILGLSKLRPGATPAQVRAHLSAEAHRAWELYQQGIFREMYTCQDRPGAAVVLECESVEAAREVINSLTLVQEGLTEFDLIPLGYFKTLELLIESKEKV